MSPFLSCNHRLPPNPLALASVSPESERCVAEQQCPGRPWIVATARTPLPVLSVYRTRTRRCHTLCALFQVREHLCALWKCDFFFKWLFVSSAIFFFFFLDIYIYMCVCMLVRMSVAFVFRWVNRKETVWDLCCDANTKISCRLLEKYLKLS